VLSVKVLQSIRNLHIWTGRHAQLKLLNFRIQAKSSAVAGRLFQILTTCFPRKVLSNIYMTVKYGTNNLLVWLGLGLVIH